MTSTGSVGRDERLRLFLALRLPDDALDAVVAWQEQELASVRGRVVPREHLHITLAFLGSRPARELDTICAVLADCSERARRFLLTVERYRETRSVGMLGLRDGSGGAAELARCVQERLEKLGLLRRESRPWLPHLTVVRFRERLRLDPCIPQLAAFAPSDAAAFLSRLHPAGAQYEVLQSCVLGG